MMTRAGRRPGAQAFLATLAGMGWMVPAADAANGDAGTLASADTYVSVEAGERAPRVTAFGARGGPVWVNRTAEALPERVVVRGADPAEVNRLLVSAGIPVTGLALQRPTLEQVVLAAAGPSTDRVEASR